MKLMPVFLALATCAQAQVTNRVCLCWHGSPSPDLSGYRLYHGTNSGRYDRVYDVGNVTNACVTNVMEMVTNYFVVTARDTSGLESDPSYEVFCQVPYGGTIPVIGGPNCEDFPFADFQMTTNATRIITFPVRDKDGPVELLTLTVTSTNQVVLPVANVVFHGTSTNRSIIIYSTNQIGSSLVRVTVEDPQKGCSSIAFMVSVGEFVAPRRPQIHSQR